MAAEYPNKFDEGNKGNKTRLCGRKFLKESFRTLALGLIIPGEKSHKYVGV